ncbi:acyl-CoA N-acyltransferase [Lentinula lateritia]|uniref:Acyl-CoA N-acyltransferase n=1 Tax=Lentinula lateritia TaxID=40482 RepID=A0ABQ8V3K7_9AGAR|nr:acyl-CoA N-acyltransferase [Lentinula lateritia]
MTFGSPESTIVQEDTMIENGVIADNLNPSHISLKVCPPSSEAYRAIVPQLATLLKSCIDANITMNFIQPFSIEDASAFWLSAEENVVQKKQFVIIAQESSEDEADDNDSRHEQHVQRGPPVILGCVILYLAQLPNAKHRAEVGKLIVGREHRKRGIGKMLVDRMEDEARKHGRKILVLDTETGSGAELFYERVGYSKAGVIPDATLAPDGKQYTSYTYFYKRL